MIYLRWSICRYWQSETQNRDNTGRDKGEEGALILLSLIALLKKRSKKFNNYNYVFEGEVLNTICLDKMNNNNFSKKDKQKLINWLISLQNNDGGFSMEKGGSSTIKCSYYIFRSLLKLEKIDWINKKGLLEFILSNKNQNGIFYNHKGKKPNPQITSYAIFMLKELSALSSIDTSKIRKCLNAFKREDGGFSGSPVEVSSIKFTYYIARSLYLLGATCDLNKEGLVKFILRRRSPGGGFSKKLGGKPDLLLIKQAIFLLDEISCL